MFLRCLGNDSRVVQSRLCTDFSVLRDFQATLRNGPVFEQKRGAIGICALRRYRSRKGTLIASYNWHVAQDFHYHMKLLRNG